MDDIQYCSRDCNLYLFADDNHKCFVTVVVKQYLMLLIKHFMCDLNSWFLRNRLSLNLDKTNFSVFDAGKSHINFELIIDGTVIKQVNTCNYLGIIWMTNYHGKVILTLCTIKWLDLLAFLSY